MNFWYALLSCSDVPPTQPPLSIEQLDKAQLLFGIETSEAIVFGEDSCFILKTPEAEAA